MTAAVTPLVIYGPGHEWPQFPMRLLVTIFMFSWSWGVFCCLPLILQLFPTGEAVEPAFDGTVLADPRQRGPWQHVRRPNARVRRLVLPGRAMVGRTEGITSDVTSLILFASAASLIVRFIRGSETVRQQVLWLLVAVILVILINVPIWFTIPTRRNVLLLLSFPLIPAAATIAVLRPRLYDARIVVSRVVVYAVLTAGVIVIYAGLVAVLDQVLRGAGHHCWLPSRSHLPSIPSACACSAWSTTPSTARVAIR
jgi:two-component system NarL family sensor kinase